MKLEIQEVRAVDDLPQTRQIEWVGRIPVPSKLRELKELEF